MNDDAGMMRRIRILNANGFGGKQRAQFLLCGYFGLGCSLRTAMPIPSRELHNTIGPDKTGLNPVCISQGHDDDIHLLAGFEPPRHAAAAGVAGV